MISDEYPKTFREVGIMLAELRNDVREIKSGQQKVVWWVAGMVASLMVGGILGWVFQK